MLQIPQTAAGVDALTARHPVLYCPTAYGGCGERLVACAQRADESRQNYFRHKSESDCAGGVSAAHYFIVQQVARHLQSLGYVTEDETTLAAYGRADLALLDEDGTPTATVEVQVSGLNGQVLDYRDKKYRESVRTVCWLFGRDLRSLAEDHAEQHGMALQVSVDGDGVVLWAVTPDPDTGALIFSGEFRLEECGWCMDQGLTHGEIDKLRDTVERLVAAREKAAEERARLEACREELRKARARREQEEAAKRAAAHSARKKHEARRRARAKRDEERAAVREACATWAERKEASRAAGRSAAKAMAVERDRVQALPGAEAITGGSLFEVWDRSIIDGLAQVRPFGIRTYRPEDRDLGTLVVRKTAVPQWVGTCQQTGRAILEVSNNKNVSLHLPGWKAHRAVVQVRANNPGSPHVWMLKPGEYTVPKSAVVHTVPLAAGGKRAVLRVPELRDLRRGVTAAGGPMTGAGPLEMSMQNRVYVYSGRLVLEGALAPAGAEGEVYRLTSGSRIRHTETGRYLPDDVRVHIEGGTQQLVRAGHWALPGGTLMHGGGTLRLDVGPSLDLGTPVRRTPTPARALMEDPLEGSDGALRTALAVTACRALHVDPGQAPPRKGR